MGLAVVTLIVLILINAFFAAAEMALVSLHDNKVKQQAEAGDKRYQLLYHLISEPSRFLSTIQIGITLAGFLASAFAADFFAEPLAIWLDSVITIFPYSTLYTISLVSITVVLSLFTLIFGELVPKNLALQQSEKIAILIARPLRLLFILFYPAVKFLSFSTLIFVKLFGGDPDAKRRMVTEEEIRLMVDVGGERGTINPDEKEMINRIFEFNDKSVSNIITHRTDMVALSLDTSLQETVEVINKNPYSRYPVYDGTVDQIVGVLYVKDLFRYIDGFREDAFDLPNVIRKPYFVIETRKIDHLFASMKEKNIHIAIVLDEYGGTEGIVTLEDIVEEIVGDISSEDIILKTQEEAIEQVGENEYIAEGIVSLHQVEETLEMELPVQEFDTLNGFLINQIGYIPSQDDHPTITYQNAEFRVTKVGENRIELITIIMKDEK